MVAHTVTLRNHSAVKSHCRVSHAACNRRQFSFVVPEYTYKTPQRPSGVTKIVAFVREFAIDCKRKAFYYGNLYKEEILLKFRREFRRRSSGVSVSSKSTIRYLVRDF